MTTKISTKILELMRLIPNEQAFEKFNETLILSKLIPQTKYQIVGSKEQITREGVVWQFVTVSCELTIIDTESGESLTYVALGTGMDTGSLAVMRAQDVALTRVCMGTVNLSWDAITSEPEIIVETPESKLISEIHALWKWPDTDVNDYITRRRGKGLSELNLPELTVEKNELEGYLRGNK